MPGILAVTKDEEWHPLLRLGLRSETSERALAATEPELNGSRLRREEHATACSESSISSCQLRYRHMVTDLVNRPLMEETVHSHPGGVLGHCRSAREPPLSAVTVQPKLFL
jgi:hypothetical protein